jgi:glycosyltransferase involved in cell wall biosynthesis
LGLKAFFYAARLLYPLATGVAAVSDNVADSVRRHVRPLPVRLKTLPNPVVFPGFLDRVLENPGHLFLHPKTGPVFVAVGRLERQKNHALLIRAFSVLVRSMAARLIIFGEGSLRVALEAQRSALGLEKVIDLPGYVDNPLAAMRAADTLVLSSHWEGLPTVAIEAMACGTQVVSTDNSAGIRAILRDREYGWITPPDDAPALAEAMAQSIQAPKNTAALTARAQDFEAGAVAGLYLSYFRQIGAAKF